ncbi:hypothetical protein Pgy4_06312 [Pseudomonas savastanoi pv. glycinea str. race 4]|uniref:Uncharacterized protein n=1 Tax=Pseudomonas savastanoi pv. glycinea str. race 4 TaxID=875330 RepID=F3C1C2_PSESG|nr:hypothetical protein Pgy4_06312 [Pseudomonas savastanoi pv. glycinea str. race 4]
MNTGNLVIMGHSAGGAGLLPRSLCWQETKGCGHSPVWC